MRDLDSDNWICPYCGAMRCIIIENAVLKNDWEEILCGCLDCNELYIRKYQFIETVKLMREKVQL